MRLTQIRNMLDEVRDFRHHLAEYYSLLSDKAAEQRVKMLLDYISSHEKNLYKSLAAYEEQASRQVMDTWVDCRHCEEILATCKQTPIEPELSVEGVTQLVMDVDQCLLRFYREVAGNAEFETVREVFRNLIDMQESELHKHARNAQDAISI